jgi:hypothetical protein
MMKKLLLLAFSAVAALAQCPHTAPAGYECTQFFGTPVAAQKLSNYMGNWQTAVMNQSVAALVNQGDNSPQALSDEALAVANGFCKGVSNTPVSECASPATIAAVVTPIQQQLSMAASLVPAGQWNPSTFDIHQASTLSLALQLAAAKVAPPPPAQVAIVGSCFQAMFGPTMCTGAPGLRPDGVKDGQVVTNPDGKQYVAHVTQGLMGVSVWFSPLQ